MDISYMNPAQQALAKDIIQKCAMSRVYFVETVLGVEHVEDWQMEQLIALDEGETKLSIRSGHGVGKTAFCSWLAIHFLLFRDDVKIIVTAPAKKQMEDGLIPEIQKWLSRCPEWMTHSLTSTSERITRSPSPRNNFISFRTARKENPEALAGVHAQHVLIIVDEASGVDEVVYETGQGALSTKGAIAVLIGNPTKPSGFFFKTHTTLRDLWRTARVSCTDSSRVDESYIASQARTYGLDSREYNVRVLGNFPESGADAIIPRAFVESAIDRDVHLIEGNTVWGLDPGRGGDPSGFCSRGPNTIYEVTELRYDNLMRLVGWVKTRWDALPPSKRPSAIYVDSIGMGAGVADRLEEMGLPVVAVNVAESASMSERFVRLRPELWYKAREWFEKYDVTMAAEMENLVQFVEELSAVEQKIMSNGKVDVESKSDMKSRGLKSPNLADSFIITLGHDGAIASGNVSSSGKWAKADTSKYRAPSINRRARV